jgi:2-keto-3-deoxy-L-rhamnonate aldolase RhmA
MKSARILRQKMASGQPVIGMLCTNHFWLQLIELGMTAGLDYLIVDLEHQDHGSTLVSDACMIGRLTDFPILIRPARTDRESIRLAVDAGACGLLCPMVNTVEQMNEIQAGVLMPPRGERRPGGLGNQWVQDFQYSTWKTEVEDDFIVWPQIESPQGLENCEQIALHPLCTALAIGPYDLSARLGCCWTPDDPLMVQAKQRLRNAADAAGKLLWMIGDGPTNVKLGYRLLCVAEPFYLLRAAVIKIVDETRANVASTDHSSKPFIP